MACIMGPRAPSMVYTIGLHIYMEIILSIQHFGIDSRLWRLCNLAVMDSLDPRCMCPI